MQRNFEPMCKLVEGWQRSELNDVTAKVVIYEAFVEGRLEAPSTSPEPCMTCTSSRSTRNSGRERCGVSSNAFTSAFKDLDPIPQFPRIASKRTANGTHENSCRVLCEGFGAASIKVPGHLSHGVLHQFRRFARVAQKVLSLSAGSVPDLVCSRTHVQPDWPACGIHFFVPPNGRVATRVSHRRNRQSTAIWENTSRIGYPREFSKPRCGI